MYTSECFSRSLPHSHVCYRCICVQAQGNRLSVGDTTSTPRVADAKLSEPPPCCCSARGTAIVLLSLKEHRTASWTQLSSRWDRLPVVRHFRIEGSSSAHSESATTGCPGFCAQKPCTVSFAWTYRASHECESQALVLSTCCSRYPR